MEPLSVATLMALAGGLGGAAGTEAWQRLSALVRRPFRRGTTTPANPDENEAEPLVRALLALQASPDPSAAQTLLGALQRRAAIDSEFNDALASWATQVQTVHIRTGDVSNVVSGGTQGTVLQARDISGPITFGASAPSRADNA
ncbi:hypothetical protein [Streptomyces sp. NPDC047000]|uniref:hypothetical protein n=1 Tax=Streptomyces sp. NPDC047000 TaxID=3155474 RepID=UPI0033DF18B2